MLARGVGMSRCHGRRGEEEEDDGWVGEWRGCNGVGAFCWDEQDCYVTAVFGFLMNLSLPAHWLLSCYCWQGERAAQTRAHTHTRVDKVLCQAKKKTTSQTLSYEGAAAAHSLQQRNPRCETPFSWSS